MLRQLLEHVEFGWEPVATLQIASEAIAHGRPVDQRVAKLVAFVLRDLVGAFRRCASAASVLVPGTAAMSDGVLPVDEAAESFDRYLNVLHLAAADRAIPGRLAAEIRSTVEALADWAPEFAVLGTASAAQEQEGTRPT